MAFIRNINVPPTKTYEMSFQNFSGGLNNASSDSEVLDNQATKIENMIFTNEGAIEKRKGKQLYGSGDIVGSDITFIGEYKPYTGANVLITATSANVYADGVLIKAVSGNIQGVTFMNYFVFVDGSDIYVYDGTTCKILSNPPVGYTPLPNPAVLGVVNSDATNIWYEPCDYELDDEYKGENIIPTNPKYIVTHKSRIIISGSTDDPNNIYISDLERLFYFPVILPVQPTPDGDYITAIHVFQDVLIIGRREDIWALYGDTNRLDVGDVFRLKFINTHTGIASNASISLMHNYMVYLGRDGNVYRMITPLTDVRYLTTEILSRNVLLKDAPLSLDEQDFLTAKSIFHNDMYMLDVAGTTLVYDYRRLAWTVFTGLDISSFYVNDFELLIGSSDGYIYKFGYDYNDNGLSIDAVYESKRYDMGQATKYKHFRELFFVFHTFSGYDADIDIKFEIDYIDVKETVSIYNRLFTWGISLWGDLFITRNVNASIPIILGRRGRVIKFIIENNVLDQPIRFYELNGDYILRGRR